MKGTILPLVTRRPLTSADARPEQKRGQDRVGGSVRLQADGQRRRHRHRGANRDVDSAGDQDDGLAKNDRRIERHLPGEILEIAAAEEQIADGERKNHEDRHRDQRAQYAECL